MNLYLTLLIHQKYLWDSCSHELIQKPADAAQERRIRALDSWHRALENFSLRMDCPDAYNEELLRQADEMDRLGVYAFGAVGLSARNSIKRCVRGKPQNM